MAEKILPQSEDETKIDSIPTECCDCDEGWVFDDCGKGHLCEYCDYWEIEMTKESKFVKRARKTSGLSQTQIAKKLGWGSGQFVSNIECGRSGMPLKRVKTFIELTGCSAKGFLKTKIADFKEAWRLEVK